MNCVRWGIRNLTKGEIVGKRVIEVGAYDVNGSLRYGVELLEPAEYVGVDIVKGPGVDRICAAEDLVQTFGKETFDVVISTCALEHVRDWKRSVSNMKTVCKSGGTILIIVPSDFPFHEYPYDFWRYKREDMKDIFSDCEILKLDEDPHKPSLVYAKIRKPHGFIEKDLSDYKLHSVIVNRRVRDICREDFQRFHYKYLVLKRKLGDAVLKASRYVFSKM